MTSPFSTNTCKEVFPHNLVQTTAASRPSIVQVSLSLLLHLSPHSHQRRRGQSLAFLRSLRLQFVRRDGGTALLGTQLPSFLSSRWRSWACDSRTEPCHDFRWTLPWVRPPFFMFLLHLRSGRSPHRSHCGLFLITHPSFRASQWTPATLCPRVHVLGVAGRFQPGVNSACKEETRSP